MSVLYPSTRDSHIPGGLPVAAFQSFSLQGVIELDIPIDPDFQGGIFLFGTMPTPARSEGSFEGREIRGGRVAAYADIDSNST